MTSQVVLSNSYGIAIASDTAVTTGGRVLNGVTKILQLPEPHKLAVLVSNNAGFMDVPWESIIHEWSKSLTEPLETLELYWTSLSTWLATDLSSNSSVKSAERDAILRCISNTEWYLYTNILLPFLRNTLGRRLDHLEWDTLETGTPSKVLVEKIADLLPFEQFAELTNSFESSSEQAWDELGDAKGGHYGQVISSYLEWRIANFDVSFEDYFMPRWPHATNLLPYLLENAAIQLSMLDTDYESVLCFAGYGNQDLFPSLLQLSTHGMFGNLVHVANYRYLSPDPNPKFLFLGQKDALENLMYGFNSTVERAFLATEQRIQNITNAVNPDTTSLRDFLQNQADNSENRRIIHENSLEPPLNRLISSSPLKNLGEFAGSLVSIQAAFATITQPNPTVGGLIDIATVNLRSGFSWIQHEQ
jgi:hypothetical protein